MKPYPRIPWFSIVIATVIMLMPRPSYSQFVDILYPPDGAILQAGQNIRVLWDSDRIFEDLEIRLISQSQSFILLDYFDLCYPYLHTDPDGHHFADCVLPANWEVCDATVRIDGRNGGPCYNLLQLQDQTDGIKLLRPGVASIQVTEPNGGEVWPLGSSQVISWSNAGGSGTYAIYLSTNGGITFNPVPLASGLSECARSWIWSNVSPETVAGRIKVVCTNAQYTRRDSSNANFEIRGPAPVVTLTSPNGDECREVGLPYDITWTRTGGSVSAYDIELSRNGGTSYLTLATGVSGTDDSWQWLVSGSTTTQARIRVRGHWQGGSVQDASNGNFVIASSCTPVAPAIAMIHPASGECFQIGAPRSIEWSHTGGTVTHYTLQLARDGSNYSTLVSELSGLATSWPWPVTGPNSATARVRVIAYWSGGNVQTTSDVFQIQMSCGASPTIAVSVPQAGSIWAVGSLLTILWNVQNPGGITGYQLYKSADGGSSWSWIGSTGASSTGFSWQVVEPISGNCRVKVVSQGAVAEGTSGAFTISPNGIGMVYVDANAAPGGNGSITWPFRTLTEGINAVPTNGTVLVRSNTYARPVVPLTRAMEIRSLNGQSTIQ